MFLAEPYRRCHRGRGVLSGGGRAARALGITDGLANVDVKLTPEGPRIVEVNGRLGGNVHLLMELAGGPSILPLVFRIALGQDMEAEPAVERIIGGTWPRIGYFAWIQAPMSATRLSGVTGYDEVAALPFVTSVVRNQREGDALDWAAGAGSNVGEVFGSVDSYEDLAAARRRSMQSSRLSSTRHLNARERAGASRRVQFSMLMGLR